MNLTSDEKQAILDELLDSLSPKLRENFPPNITAQEYAEREGINRRLAYDRLEKAVACGKLRKENDVKINGRSCCIYYVP